MGHPAGGWSGSQHSADHNQGTYDYMKCVFFTFFFYQILLHAYFAVCKPVTGGEDNICFKILTYTNDIFIQYVSANDFQCNIHVSVSNF